MNPDFPNDPRSVLEARLTALLLGELPPDQAAALNELLARDAELSRLRPRLEHAIKLLREVEAAPAAPAETPAATPKLSEARRQQLLQHFKTVALTPKESARPARRRIFWLVPAAAAAALVLLGVAALLPSLARPKSRSYASRPSWVYRGEQNVTLAPPAASLPADKNETAENELRRAVKRPPTQFGLPSSGDLAARQRPVIVLPSNEVAGKEMFDAPATVAATPAQQGINGGYAVNRDARGGAFGGGFGTWAADAERPPGAASASSVGRKLGRAPAAKAEGVRDYAYSVVSAPTAKLGEAALPETKIVELNWAATTEPGRNHRLGFAFNEPVPASPDIYSGVVAGQDGARALVIPETAAVTGLPAAGDAAQPSQPPAAAGGAVVLGTNISAIAPTRRARAGAEGQDALAAQSRDSALHSTRMAGQDIGGAAPALRSETFQGALRADAAAATPTTPAKTPSIAAGGRYARGYAAGVAGPAPGIVLPKEPALNYGAALDRSSEPQAGPDKDAGGRETSRDSSKAKEPLSAGIAFFETGRSQLEDSLGIAEVPLRADAAALGDERRKGEASRRPSEARQQVEPAGALKQQAEVQATTTLESKLAPAKESLEREPAKPASDAADLTPAKPVAPPPVPQPEVLSRENAFSTFSLNVSDVSFKLAAASLEKGQMPEPATIRSEEFLNAFDYRDPEPPTGIPIAFAWERARYPFAHHRDLLRFSVKTAAEGRQAGRPLNLVLLLDNSGSMERADRVQIIREALRVLATQLQPQDKLSVITFARTARLWVDGAPGDQAAQVAERLSGLTPQGGTNLEEAMRLAYETARRHYLERGINRVVLLTDGAANLGEVEPGALKREVEAHRKQGIALDCFGIGWEGYNDDLLETLARNGDGRYGFLNTPEEAATGFAGQLAGALKVAASDVKVQVEFNPDRVRAYRQIGYAKHQLTQEQFRDNTVDAAEIGAAESGNALYVIEALPGGRGPVAIVRVRYKVPGTADYREMEWTVPYTGSALSLDQASPALRLAAAASAFAEWLAASPFAAEVTPDRLLALLRGVPDVYGADGRPKQLEWMIRQAKSIAGQ